MPCYSPITGYRSRYKSKNGKRPLVFSGKDGYTDLQVTVPCGKCYGCRLEYSRQWAIRCVHEAQLHENNAFITLTYAPEKLPEDHSVSKEELQKFFKRLRKTTGKKLRYFACGEYGKQKNRPHYHAIIFGYDFPDRTLYSKSNGNLLYRSETLEKCWTKGFSTIGHVTFESCAYVARYVMKKYTNKDEDKVKDAYTMVDQDTGEAHHMSPEFCLMSRRPGIGHDWLHQYKNDTNKDYITIRGTKMSLPKYYDMLLEKYGEDMETRKIDRRKKVDKKEQTHERLNTRETVKRKQTENLVRHFEDA